MQLDVAISAEQVHRRNGAHEGVVFMERMVLRPASIHSRLAECVPRHEAHIRSLSCVGSGLSWEGAGFYESQAVLHHVKGLPVCRFCVARVVVVKQIE